MRQRGDLGLQPIDFDQANGVKHYFSGLISESDMIDIQYRSKTLLSKSELRGVSSKDQVLRKREEKLNAKEELAARISKEKSMSVNDFLIAHEVKLQNRSTVLQSQHSNFLKVLHLCHQRHETPDQK